MIDEFQSMLFVVVFVITWIVFVVSGGIMGALFGWIPAFLVAYLLAEYTVGIILLIALVLFSAYVINLSHG